MLPNALHLYAELVRLQSKRLIFFFLLFNANSLPPLNAAQPLFASHSWTQKGNNLPGRWKRVRAEFPASSVLEEQGTRRSKIYVSNFCLTLHAQFLNAYNNWIQYVLVTGENGELNGRSKPKALSIGWSQEKQGSCLYVWMGLMVIPSMGLLLVCEVRSIWHTHPSLLWKNFNYFN